MLRCALGTRAGTRLEAPLPVASDRVVAHLCGVLTAPTTPTLLQILLMVLLLQCQKGTKVSTRISV